MNRKLEQINIDSPDGPGNWKPIIGQETLDLVSNLSIEPSNKETLLKEAIEILSQCGDPKVSDFSDVGLAFGYVQSGKTLSFTTLTALAKDNGYQIIIIIAGISTNLVFQSSTRLEEDLRIDSRSDMQWLSFKNPRSNDSTTKELIKNALESWRDVSVPDEDHQTILITVMKQKNHLPNLCDLLASIDLTGVPVLIIDDEGDQHSMNNQNRRNARTGNTRKSAIHDRIVNLRKIIPHHTFIQYTATPQGPLFQDLMNDLSPKFIQLLTPGNGYTGGKVFFKEKSEVIRIIDDIDHHQFPSTPPDSLIYAMMISLLV